MAAVRALGATAVDAILISETNVPQTFWNIENTVEAYNINNYLDTRALLRMVMIYSMVAHIGPTAIWYL